MFSHTFVVLAYKKSEHLEASLQSRINQRESSKILISTSTPSQWLDRIALQYDIPVIVNSSELGIANDWNFALASADSEYVTLAHQDDVFHADYAKALKAAAERYPDNSIIFSDYAELIDYKVRKINLNLLIKRLLLLPMYLHPGFKHHWSKQMILSFGNPVCCPAVTYHKSLIPKFRFNTSFSINLDWDAWFRIADMQGTFVYLRRILFFIAYIIFRRLVMA